MNTPYKIVTLSELVLDSSKPVCFDSETVGKYGRIRLAQFYQQGEAEVQLVEWPEPFALAALLGSYRTYMHNCHYDITTIQQNTDTRWIPKQFDDTFLLSRLAFPRSQAFDLESMLTLACGFDPYERQHLDKKKLQKSNWGVAKLSEDQYLYAATDVYYLPVLIARIEQCEETISYKLDMHALRYSLDFQWNGMPVDPERINARYRANQARIAELAVPINVNSYQQVRKYLETTESDDLALAKMALEGNQKAADLRETRKLIKQNSFLSKYSNHTTLFGKFKPSARSGRFTSDDENLQQIPRSLKGCFTAEEGKVLIFADYAQLELRTICAITACTLMAEKFYAGEDLHDFTTEMIFGTGWTKEQRQLTKTANFNFLYGGGVGVFISILIKSANMLISEREGYALRKRWRNLWREIYHWQEKGIDAWKKQKAWATPLGRQYVGKMMTDQLNIQNQGAGAEVSKLALHYLYPKIPAGAQLCNFIHDSFILQAEPEVADETAQLLADSMQEAWREMSKCFAIKDIPMPVEVRIGTNWGDIEAGQYLRRIVQ